MAVPERETATQARMPQRPQETMADKGKGSKSKTPAMPSNMAAHVPVRAAEHMAAKGKHVDGMAKHAAMGTETRTPTMAPSHSNKAGGKPGRHMGG